MILIKMFLKMFFSIFRIVGKFSSALISLFYMQTISLLRVVFYTNFVG